MVAMVAALAGAAIQVVKWAAKPIIRQFSYLCCFASNIDGLKQEADELDMATRGLQGQVDRERENVRVILPQVESWLTKSNDIKGQKDTILDEVLNVKSGCFKIGARYGLSKRAVETTDIMKELRVEKNFNPISEPGPPASTQEIPLGKTYEFESRKYVEEEIITSLQDVDLNMIGIHGMGGLGKTTMAQRIMNRVLKENIFEEAVITTISQQVDKSNIQDEIGGSLGLNLQYSTSQVRVKKLHARLTGDTKRILLVLDDVWEGLELQNLGIPCDSKQCKILVTSRNMDALSEMGVQKIFGMKVLPQKDAWFLFSERAGTCVYDAKLNPIAKKVVDECGGLPIALTAVGGALKNKKDERIWKDALRQLKKCDQDIPSFIEKVYNPLKLSYDFLKSRQAQSLILLCCLFPEDARIRLDQLTYICMGLGIFEGMDLEATRNKVCTLAQKLKSQSLLLDGYRRDEVRMHDVVRDFCKIIAKQEGYIGGNDCPWISSSVLIGERTSGLRFPNLRLLLSTHNSKLDGEFKLDSVFLEGIKDLHVLWIEKSPLTSLTLKNLKTFVLDSCHGLKTISVVGELVNLEILVCRNCYLLEELPLEIKGLNRLKLLDLTACKKLQRIHRGIISSLVGLEELKMLDSFKNWKAEDKEEIMYAPSLKELQALTNLTCLEIEMEDSDLAYLDDIEMEYPALVAVNMHISTNLQKFNIMHSVRERIVRQSARRSTDVDLPPRMYHMYNKKMSLQLKRETCLGQWIEMQLLRETEALNLWGKGAKNVDLGKCQNIKWLRLSECEMTKLNIVTTSLEYMELRHIFQLQEVSISFQNLSSITITDCPNLVKLPLAAGKDCLPQLEKLCIERCKMMEHVFLWEEENTNGNISEHVKTLPKLKAIHLNSLPNLVTFCQGIQGIEFPLATKIHIQGCPKWTCMVSCSNNEDIDDRYYSHLFCQSGKVSFGNLEELETDRNPFCGHEIPVSSSYGELTKLTISNYHGSKSLLSSSIATNLVNLKTLIIERCDKMVQVIRDDDDEDEEEKTRLVLASTNNGGETAVVLFPKLEELRLAYLPKLESFCKLKCDHVVLPSLRSADIIMCPNMKKLSSGFLSAPNLVSLSTSDLNNDLELGVNVSFGNLKELETDRNPFCGHEIPVPSSYGGLTKLIISHYQGSKSLLSSSIATNLVNLKTLIIERCDKMVQVIKGDDDEDEEEMTRLVLASTNNGGEAAVVLFPKLEELRLVYLPKLESFCDWKSCDNVVLPSLRSTNIIRCPNMKKLSSGFLSAPNLISLSTSNLINDLELGVNVSFERLKILLIDCSSSEYPLSHHKFFISLVDSGLEELELRAHGSMSLFPSSLAKLMNIRSLRISGCNEMVNVIEEDEEDEEEDEVASGGRTTVLFPKLEELELNFLPKLVSFCESRKHVVELPSLRKVCVVYCYTMKYFSRGHLTAPNLESIKINDNDFEGDQRDLNGALKQHYLQLAREEAEGKPKMRMRFLN